MSVLNDFLIRYSREYDFYENHAGMIASKIEEQLFCKGIKAVVSRRVKSITSVREKIKKNNKENKYGSVAEIFLDIKDLSGVRISMYFPVPGHIIDEIMHDAFIVLDKHELLSAGKNAVYRKRYPGYNASHYHVVLKNCNEPAQYLHNIAEIQVASTLMHAWAEIDHDLVYKPSYGKPSIKELAILDEVNGLALSAENCLYKLQLAMADRTVKNGFAADKYELTNLLLVKIRMGQLRNNRLGDVYLLYNYLETLDKTAFGQLLLLIKAVRPGLPESITEQLLFMLLIRNYHPKKNTLHTYFKKLDFLPEEISMADRFISLWLAMERRIRKKMTNNTTGLIKYPSPVFKFLARNKILTSPETVLLQNMCSLKNDLLYNREKVSLSCLLNSIVLIRTISLRIHDKIKENSKNIVSAGRHI